MDVKQHIPLGFANLNFYEKLYEQYLKDSGKLTPDWRELFQTIDKSPLKDRSIASQVEEEATQTKATSKKHKEMLIARLITMYRTYGHLLADINPIALEKKSETDELKLENLGFSSDDLESLFPTLGLSKKETAPLKEIIGWLKETYCGKIGIEYMGLQDAKLKSWLTSQIESTRFKVDLSIEKKKLILDYLNKSELFENFLHTKYVGQKRFSLEGAETLIPMLAALIESGSELGMEEFVIGLAHRGRLNVLSNILDKSYSVIFTEFEERHIPDSFEGSGDVKYHKGFFSKIKTTSGKEAKIFLSPNPSHLESVCPVVEGQARAKQDKINEKYPEKKVLPVLVHGDAAISGQGVIYETLQMYGLQGYSTGGTIHIVINNQIGFTTLPKDLRSTRYCTDIAIGFNAPVIHVNVEDPEGCVFAVMLAAKVRQKFHCDVFIDLNCYRKYGHNESDEPAYTQPLEYKKIRSKKPVREIYLDRLLNQGVLEKEIAETLEREFKEGLQKAHKILQVEKSDAKHFIDKQVSSFKEDRAKMLKPVKTSVSESLIQKTGERAFTVPNTFSLHKKLNTLFDERKKMAGVDGPKKPMDWGTAEILAYSTLLFEGVSIRLAGQDTGRGTFSHRHALVVDQENGTSYVPLKHLFPSQGRFDVINSHLSEYAALAFEYGYSLSEPENLVIWEAQFGDFSNGAQVMFDQYITTSEQKWNAKSNLTVFLPHGYEGQGPEHSSARIERFLTLAAENNIYVVYPTTPAQHFHLIRRQVLKNNPKPLIVFTPKGLLRHPKCVSTLKDITHGKFHEVIDDLNAPSKVSKLVFCSGRIYYDLIEEREKHKKHAMAIVRIEQLYPMDFERVKEIIENYKGFKECFFAQEEPENMGPWEYIRPRLTSLLPKGVHLRYAGRRRSASTATGSVALHKQQLKDIKDVLFSGAVPIVFDLASQSYVNLDEAIKGKQ